MRTNIDEGNGSEKYRDKHLHCCLVRCNICSFARRTIYLFVCLSVLLIFVCVILVFVLFLRSIRVCSVQVSMIDDILYIIERPLIEQIADIIGRHMLYLMFTVAKDDNHLEDMTASCFLLLTMTPYQKR
jgi:hypothetical protein